MHTRVPRSAPQRSCGTGGWVPIGLAVFERRRPRAGTGEVRSGENAGRGLTEMSRPGAAGYPAAPGLGICARPRGAGAEKGERDPCKQLSA